MLQKFLKGCLLFFVCVIITYTFYVYWLQSASLSSPMRLFLITLIGIAIFAILLLSLRQFEKKLVIDKFFLWGLFGTFLLTNLFLTSFLGKIPYTNQIIPTRVVNITPEQIGQRIKIKSFKTELAEGASTNSFTTNQGWEMRNGQIVSLENHILPLVWRGKPGETVELRFVSCANCSKVNIDWGDGSYETVDLKQSNDNNKTITIIH